MTAYEMASLHAQFADNLNAALGNWLAILTVYLGSGYLVAHRLTLSSAIALSGVFLLVLGGFSLVMFRAMTSWVGVGREIRRLAEQGKGLEWHQAATTPAWVLDTFATNSLIMMWIAIVASGYFFFSSRRQNLKTQPVAQ